MHRNNDELLRIGLTANTVFSIGTGLLLTVLPAAVGEILGVEIDGWLRLLGVALIVHGVVLAAVTRSAKPDPFARLNLLMIVPYPVLMIGLVVTGLVDRTLGQVLVLADGAIVGSFALLQSKGLRTLDEVPDPQLV